MKRLSRGIVAAGFVLVLAACGTDAPGTAALPGTTNASVQPSVNSSDPAPTGASDTSAADPTVVETSAPEPVTSSADLPTSEEPAEVTTSDSPAEPTDVSTESTSVEEPTDVTLDPEVALLIARLDEANAAVTSVSGQMRTEIAGQKIDMTFKQELVNGAPSAMEMNMPMGPVEISFILLDDKIYMGGTMAESFGKPWVELSATSKDATLVQMYETFESSLSQTSTAQYATFMGMLSSFTAEGSEEIDGQPADKYNMVIDLTKADASGLDPAMQESLKEMAASGLKEFEMAIWLDAEDHVVQVQQQMDIMGQEVVTQVNMFDYNEPVNITAPDPADVAQG